MFDLNDFDETLPGPWEWDVNASRPAWPSRPAERLLAQEQHDAARLTVRSYREAMLGFAELTTLDCGTCTCRRLGWSNLGSLEAEFG